MPDCYDDGGFTGGNMERPALRRLMLDIEARKINTVVVYKVDRLSRSLLDFARMMQVFDSRKLSFVSVKQQFDSAPRWPNPRCHGAAVVPDEAKRAVPEFDLGWGSSSAGAGAGGAVVGGTARLRGAASKVAVTFRAAAIRI